MTTIPFPKLRIVIGCFLVWLALGASSQAQTTSFTYQGSLVISGSVASGSYDLQFQLYDQLTGGALQGSPNTVTVSSVAVANGVFTADLDFGASAFPGAARYLEISVRPAGSGSFTTLSPRQQLTSTPYAIRSLNATSADTATTTMSFSGSLSGDVTGTQGTTVVSMVGGVTASNVATGATLANNATSINTSTAIVKRDTTGSFTASTITATLFSGSGASITNLNATNIGSGTLADTRLSSNVALKNFANTFTADQTVNANLIQSGTLVQFTPTNGFVAGGTIGSGSIPATGAGVRMMWYPKKGAFRAGLAGGSEWDDANIATASVAMGDNTKASGAGSFAAGSLTTASGPTSVALGDTTTASGAASVALGFNTTASGFFTTALGNSASTNGMNGSFVYGDNSTSGILSATLTNQYNVRAAGGLRFFASSDTSDESKPGMFISGTTGNTQINGTLTVSGLISGSGASLTGLNAGNISSGVLAIANGGTGSATQNFVDLSSTQTGISGNKSFTGLVAAGAFSGGGANLSNLNASNISSGSLNDARLSSNVALKNAANTFTADQTVNANLTQSGTLVQFTPTNGFVAGGTSGSGSIPATGAGTRMMWYPGKASFRAGTVSGTEWDNANIGLGSVAIGHFTTASAEGSVALGLGTTASGDGSVAVGNITTASAEGSVAMGELTIASGKDSVAMGFGTTASGSGSVALGNITTASGNNTTALGNHASTGGQAGTFVYGDNSTSSDISATATNQFVVRAQRMWFGTNNSVTATSGRFLETSTGAYLTTGGAWTNSSSRALKTNFAAVNPRDVLRKVLQLPIQTWNYKAEDARVRHIGAISQDFHGLFGFGDSAETISTVDADGVALAAIQGLHEELKDRDAKLEQQQQELGQLKQQVKQQQAVIEGMRKLICAQTPNAEICQKP